MADLPDSETISRKIRTCMEEYAEREMDIALTQGDARPPTMCWTRASSVISQMKQAAAAAKGENGISSTEGVANLFSEGTPPPSHLYNELMPMQGVGFPDLSPSGGSRDSGRVEVESGKTVRSDEETGEVTITTKVSIGPKTRKKSSHKGRRGARVHRKLIEPDYNSVPVVTSGLLAHLAYCKENGVSKEEAVEHFAEAYDRFNEPFAENETWINRMEEMLDPVEFERQAKTTLREVLAAAVSRCR